MMQLELPHVNVLTKMDLLKRSSAEVEQCVVGKWCSLDSLGSQTVPQVSPAGRPVLLARAAAQHGWQVRQIERSGGSAGALHVAWRSRAGSDATRFCRLTTTASSASCRLI